MTILLERHKRAKTAIVQRLTEIAQTEPFWLASATPLTEPNGDTARAELLAAELKEHIATLSAERGGALPLRHLSTGRSCRTATPL